MKQLNSYLGCLPGLIDSLKMIKTTKEIEPFNEANLVQLILKMCPRGWHDQYALTQGNIPQVIRFLLVVLEVIKNTQEKITKKIPGNLMVRPEKEGTLTRKSARKFPSRNTVAAKKTYKRHTLCSLQRIQWQSPTPQYWGMFYVEE